jgi:glycosyltransferase involved in cell wall biosynthesis
MASINMQRLIDLFSWQKGYYPIDVVFCSRAGIAPMISLALSEHQGTYTVPVVITEPHVYGPGDISHNRYSQTQQILRGAGYAACYGVYWAKYEYEAAKRSAEFLCSPGAMQGFDERSFLVDALVDVDEAAKSVNRAKTRKRLIFAGRLNARNKRYQQIIDQYAKVLMTRSDIEVWIHSGTGAIQKMNDKAGDHRWHITSERLLREDYWKLLGSSHVGAYYSVDEGANVTTEEMIACGCVMALPDRPWVRKLFHPHPYPFLFDKLDELPGLLDWLLDNHDEARKKLEPIRKMIQRERSWQPFKAGMFELFDMIKAHERPQIYNNYSQLARNANNKAGVFHSTLLHATKTWRSGTGGQSAFRGSYACYQGVRDLDTMETADPYLKADDDRPRDNDESLKPRRAPNPEAGSLDDSDRQDSPGPGKS